MGTTAHPRPDSIALGAPPPLGVSADNTEPENMASDLFSDENDEMSR